MEIMEHAHCMRSVELSWKWRFDRSTDATVRMFHNIRNYKNNKMISCMLEHWNTRSTGYSLARGHNDMEMNLESLLCVIVYIWVSEYIFPLVEIYFSWN